MFWLGLVLGGMIGGSLGVMLMGIIVGGLTKQYTPMRREEV